MYEEFLETILLVEKNNVFFSNLLFFFLEIGIISNKIFNNPTESGKSISNGYL